MRILHCLRAPVGGLFRHVLDLAEAQAERGHDVGILADANTGDALTSGKFERVAPAMSLGIHRVAMGRQPGISDITASAAVWRRVRADGIDIIHGHGAKGGAYARLAAFALNRFGPPVYSFYTPHGGSLHYDANTLGGRFYLALERLLQPAGDGLIFESGYAARQYADKIGIGETPARVIPNGLKPFEFERWQPDQNAADLVFVGELRDLKGVDVLLEAIARLTRHRIVTAAIVGAGPDGEKFRAEARALGLERQVSFKGALPAREAFRLGRHLVVPSRAESLPYVILEAAAAGLPVIATNVGGIPEIMAGTGQALVPPGNAKALAKALLEALSRPGPTLAQAEALRTAVADGFTVARMTADVLKFYTQPLSVNQKQRSATVLQHR